jgi:hypothetical protein
VVLESVHKEVEGGFGRVVVGNEHRAAIKMRIRGETGEDNAIDGLILELGERDACNATLLTSHLA